MSPLGEEDAASTEPATPAEMIFPRARKAVLWLARGEEI